MRIKKEIVQEILEDAIHAPSGENCQPWRFIVRNDVVHLYNKEEADTSLYNLNQSGSYIAHGALLENLTLSAQAKGYRTYVDLFPTQEDRTHVASISFIEDEAKILPLYHMIRRRCTNRKAYYSYTISSETLSLLKGIPQISSLTFITDPDAKKTICDMLAYHEQVLFETKELHDFFYNHIIWNKKDEDKSGGFFVDTLEFLPHQLRGVKLFKDWKVLRLLNGILKVSKMISRDNASRYATSSAIGVITTQNLSKESYVRLGADIQRIWLTATKHDLALHPCNGTFYLASYCEKTGGKEFSDAHKEGLLHAVKTIQAFSKVQAHETITFVFRIGKADAPTAKAKKLPPDIVYED